MLTHPSTTAPQSDGLVAGLEAIIDAATGILAAQSLQETLQGMADALEPIVPYTSLAVYEVDLDREEVVGEYVFDAREEESVYAVCLLPDEFSAPPRLEGAATGLFWTRASLPTGITPIPVRSEGAGTSRTNG